MRFFRSNPKISRQQSFQSVPTINPYIKWHINAEDRVVLTIKTPNKLFVKLAALIFPIPKENSIVLDEIGSFVWQLFDGNKTVEQIILKIKEKYKLNRKEAEASTIEYIKILVKRRYIMLFVPVENDGNISNSKKIN